MVVGGYLDPVILLSNDAPINLTVGSVQAEIRERINTELPREASNLGGGSQPQDARQVHFDPAHLGVDEPTRRIAQAPVAPVVLRRREPQPFRFVV